VIGPKGHWGWIGTLGASFAGVQLVMANRRRRAMGECLVSAREVGTTFTSLFERAAVACAESQRHVGDSASAVCRGRAARASNARLRRMAMERFAAWASADAAHRVLRAEVEWIASEMRDAGADREATLSTVRARLRFVLYDGGLTEQDAEPVVQRATIWIEQLYPAA
jgi:hypothetical protein